MESKKLEALVTAVDCGSFTRAAEILGYTQSGLTHMMNALEKEIGFPLLVRGHYGVHLTEGGERLLPAMKEILRSNQRLADEIALINEAKTETVRVAAYPSVAMHWLPAIIQSFRQDYPTVNVDIRMFSYVDEPLRWIQQGKMDLAFLRKEDTAAGDWIPLCRDRLYAVLPKGHPAEGQRSFDIRDFDGQEFVMPAQGFDRMATKLMEEYRFQPNIRPTQVDDATIVSMVQHGLGISMMTELMMRGHTSDVLTIPIAPETYRELGIVLQSGKDAKPIVKQFVAYSQRIVQEIQANRK